MPYAAAALTAFDHIDVSVRALRPTSARPFSDFALILSTATQDTTMSLIGRGRNELRLNIEGAISNIDRTIREVVVVVMDDNDMVGGRYYVDVSGVPLVARDPLLGEQFYTEDVVLASGTETHRFVAVNHDFEDRGHYRVGIRFEDTDGDYVTSPDAMRLTVSDGMTMYAENF